MRIGIVPALTPSGGGVYQYSITMLRALGEWKEQACEDEFILFARQAPDPTLLNGRDWTFKPLVPVQPRSQREKILEASRRIVGEGPHREAWRWLRRQLERLQYNPDLVRSRPAARWFYGDA